MSSTDPYVVRDGDYLTAIAYRFGTTVAKILAEPQNSKLKSSRPNPEILAPGDVLYIPKTKPTWTPATVGGTTAFKATPPTVKVTVVLNDHEGKPLANEAVVTDPVTTKKGDPPLTTDGSGALTLTVSIHVREIKVTVTSKLLTFMFRVGGLDPHTQNRGLLSRLRHLGYIGSEGPHTGARPWLTEFAVAHEALILARGISEYQRKNRKDVTGVADEDLQGAIKDEHGC